MSTEVNCWCRYCGTELLPSHKEPCPKCGETGKDCTVSIQATVGIKASLSMEHTRTTIQWKNKEIDAFILPIIIEVLVAVFTTLIGFALGGEIGALIGLIISIMFIITIHVLFNRKMKEITKSISKYK